MFRPKVFGPILVIISLLALSLAQAAPAANQGELLVFKMMILTSDDNGVSRADGGLVSVSVDGADPTAHPIDENGLLTFMLPIGTNARAAFDGAFTPFTLRFEFADGLMNVFNDALPATQQEARLPYYLNVDGTYVVEYRQDYLYMLAPAEPGGPILTPFLVDQAQSTSTTIVPTSSGPTIEPANTTLAKTPDPPMQQPFNPGFPCGIFIDFTALNSFLWWAYTEALSDEQFEAELGSCRRPNDPNEEGLENRADGESPNSTDRILEEGEIPTLEISLKRADGTLAFVEWVPVDSSGVINNGFHWATSLRWIYDMMFVNISQRLSADFLAGLPSGRNVIAYRLIDAQGLGSNHRLVVLMKE